MSALHCGCDPEAGYMCAVCVERRLNGSVSAGAATGSGAVAGIGPVAGGAYNPPPPSVERIAEAVRRLFPGGHPKFLPITLGEIELHAKKNHDYSSGGDPMGNFNRVAAVLAQYPKLDLADPKVVALVYLLKQLDATLWGLNSKIEHKVEGLKERMGDVSVYAKLVICMLEDSK